jgi:outer membrane protein OmpA-like peptidoglycan-associated protein
VNQEVFMHRIFHSLFALLIGAGAVAGCAHQQAAVAITVSQPAGDPSAKPVLTVNISAGVKRVQATATGFTVTEKIDFADRKATILPSSESLLQELVTVLKENSHLKQVFIAGYTSSEGRLAFNKKLSEERAAAVKAWLIAHGVEDARLVSGGFGPANPIGDNATEEGREKNRRVEFTVLKYEVNGQIHENPAPTAGPAK